MPTAYDFPVDPTSENDVMVVPNKDISSRNGPIEWLASM